MARQPKLVVFDLDDTLWTPEFHELDGPLRLDRKGRCVDQRGCVLRFRGDSEDILHMLLTEPACAGMKVGIASRSDYPEWAVPTLQLLRVRDKATLDEIVHFHEIFPDDKVNHFQKLQQRSGLAFEDMLFFDNEMRNIRSVSRLGVKCVYTPDGMLWESWREGLAMFK